MNSDSSPDNLVSFNQLQCLTLKSKILEIEGRVVNLEEEILAHANRLNDVISEELAIVTAEVEGGTNIIDINGACSSTAERTDWLSYGDTSSDSDVFDVLDSARSKLDLLNQKIETLELPS